MAGMFSAVGSQDRHRGGESEQLADAIDHQIPAFTSAMVSLPTISSWREN
jgi:hypothetical protein